MVTDTPKCFQFLDPSDWPTVSGPEFAEAAIEALGVVAESSRAYVDRALMKGALDTPIEAMIARIEPTTSSRDDVLLAVQVRTAKSKKSIAFIHCCWGGRPQREPLGQCARFYA